MNFSAVHFQQLAEHGRSLIRIVNNENTGSFKLTVCFRACGCIRRSFNYTQWKPDAQLRPVPDTFRFGTHHSAVQFGQLFYQRETDAESALPSRTARVALPENLKHVRQKLGRDSLTGVLDNELRACALSLQRDRNHSARPSEFDCVIQRSEERRVG